MGTGSRKGSEFGLGQVNLRCLRYIQQETGEEAWLFKCGVEGKG